MINKRTYLILMGLFIILGTCSKNDTQEPAYQININSLTFESSMKGWELYSWQNLNDWNYSILIGTNRLKSYDEVMNNEIVVTSKDSLKLLLDRLPTDETIIWIGPTWLARCWGNNYKNLSLPPQAIIDEIEQYCTDHHLILIVTD